MNDEARIELLHKMGEIRNEADVAEIARRAYIPQPDLLGRLENIRKILGEMETMLDDSSEPQTLLR